MSGKSGKGVISKPKQESEHVGVHGSDYRGKRAGGRDGGSEERGSEGAKGRGERVGRAMKG